MFNATVGIVQCTKLLTAKLAPPIRLKILMQRELWLFENFRFFGKYGYTRYNKVLSHRLHFFRKATMGDLPKHFERFLEIIGLPIWGYHENFWN